MPVQTFEKEIGGHSVKIVQFNAVRGFKIKARLFKLILPVLSSALSPKDLMSGKNLLDNEIDFTKAFGALSLALNEDNLFTLLLDLLSGTFVDGQMVDQKKFDELFIGNYSFAYKLAYEVIKINNFFDFGDIGSNLISQLNQVSPKS